MTLTESKQYWIGKIARNVGTVMGSCLEYGCEKAIMYVLPNFRIKATKIRGNNKKGEYEILVTIGKPNFLERQAVKKYLKAKEPFPIKRIQRKIVVNGKVVEKGGGI